YKSKIIELVNYNSNETREYVTRSDVGNIISQEYLDSIQAKNDIDAVYLANSLQQGFIYHTLHQARDSAYRVQLIFNYNNKIEPERLKKAWQGALNRYPSLRLRFAWEKELIQIIDTHQEIDWTYLDISQLSMSLQAKKINTIIKKDRQRGYSLEVGNLLRIHLIKQANDKYSFIMSAHHAILDGWSNSLLLKFVHELYTRLENQQLDLTMIEAEESYVKAQKYLQDNRFVSEIYWKDRINQIDEYANITGLLKTDVEAIQLSEYRKIKEHKEYGIKISESNYRGLKEFSYRYNITINAILEYAWHKLLSVYGYTATTVVGTIISGRNLAIDDIDTSVGLYINTLPLIVKHDAGNTILEAIKSVQSNIIEMNNHSNVSLVNLQKEGRRLFDSLFAYENYPVFMSDGINDNTLRVNSLEIIEELDYPLGVTVHEQANEIAVYLKYAGELFTQETIKNLLYWLVNLVVQISNIHEESKYVKELSYLNKEEYKKVIYDWNKTDKEYLSNQTIHELFEEQVMKTPNNIAITYKNTKLTYGELNKKSNKLANYLRMTYQIKGDD